VIFLGAGLDAAQQGGVRMETTANIGTDHTSLRNVSKNPRAMSASYAAAASTMDYMATEQATFSAEARAGMGDKTAGAGLVNPPKTIEFAKANPAQAAATAALLRPVPTSKPGDAWSTNITSVGFDDAWRK
jgi:hypothetical protein